jgi:hypothetical protein
VQDITRRRSWRGRVTAAVVLLLLAVAGAFAWSASVALSAADDARQAQARLVAARTAGTGVDDVERALADAQRLLRAADGKLDALPVRVVAALPLVGRSFAVERAVVAASVDTVDGLALVVEQGRRLTRREGEGGVDVVALRDLAEDLEQASRRAGAAFEDLRFTRTGWTPAPVSRAARDAQVALAPVVDGLRQGALGAQLAADLLGADRPRPVMFALQNNAELRGTGGYVSTVTTGVLDAGALRLEPFRDIVDVADSAERAKPVTAPADYIEDYGRYLAHTTHFRNWTMSPDVPVSAAVGARAIGELTGTSPEVVVLLDVPAMSEIVRLGGKDITLDDGTRLSADALGKALLVDEYERAGDDRSRQNARRARLGGAATRALTTLLDGSIAPLATVETLGRLAAGRHLAVWSARAEEQRALEDLGLSGAIDPGDDDLVLVSVNNLNANKLDYYVDRRVSLEARVGLSTARVVQRVRLTNTAPSTLGSYVAGEQTPGLVSERVELSFARDARLEGFSVDGRPARGFLRQRANRSAVVTYVELARGQSVELELAYSTPAPFGSYRVHLLPQPLARDAVLDLRLTTTSGGGLARVVGAATDDSGRVVESGTWERRRLVHVTARQQP